MAISHVEIYRAVVGQLTSLNANRVCRMNHLNLTIKNRMYTTDLGNIGGFFLHGTTIVSIFVLILNEGVIFFICNTRYIFIFEIDIEFWSNVPIWTEIKTSYQLSVSVQHLLQKHMSFNMILSLKPIYF